MAKWDAASCAEAVARIERGEIRVCVAAARPLPDVACARSGLTSASAQTEKRTSRFLVDRL
jgi:hypothetical protein